MTQRPNDPPSIERELEIEYGKRPVDPCVPTLAEVLVVPVIALVIVVLVWSVADQWSVVLRMAQQIIEWQP
ncbi:MAG: hypothetical protein WDZ93_01910 [Candidatus Paceibacterota bacterium]